MRKNNQSGFIVILIPIIIIIVLVIIFSGGGDKDENKTDDTAKKENTSQVISESDAEEYCQDNALLSKYLDMDKVSVIDVANYNKHYSESGDEDSDGNPTMVLQWNGKVNDERTLFVCTIGGKKDDIKLHSLSVGGRDLYSTDN